MQTLQVPIGASTFTHLAVYRPGKEFCMNKIDKIDRELEKAREKAGKAETGGRKQPDRAGCSLFEADTHRADGVLK